MISLQFWTPAAEGKTLLTPRHSLNVFLEPRTCRSVELEENTKSRLPILLVIVRETFSNLVNIIKLDRRASCLAQASIISGFPFAEIEQLPQASRV